MLCYAIHTLSERGWGPFYISTNMGNPASLRGIEKAGFQRCGIWFVKWALFDLIVITRRMAN